MNRYLGLPYVRTRYEFKRLVDDTEGQLEVKRAQINGYSIEQICNNLRGRCNWANNAEIKNYLGSLHFLNAQEDLRFIKQNSSPENSPANSTSDRRRMLWNLKEALCNAGIFQYRDMYAFAAKLVAENPELVPALRKRFPIVIIDEMQDTQKFQDTLLNQIFDDGSVCLQRLGDPDQAIFDSIGGEEPNESYNNKKDLYEIKTTHRFGLDICEKIIGLSHNSLDQLLSVREPNRGDCPHTLFIYDDASRERVLEFFGNLVAEADPDDRWRTLKAVGGVDGGSGQIRKYWSKFDRSKSATSPKPEKLIHIVHLCQGKTQGHVSSNYELLVQGVVDLLRKTDTKMENNDGKLVYFSRQSLIRWLNQKEKYHSFRKLLTSWIMEIDLSADRWTEQIETLKSILELDDLDCESADYLAFDDDHQGDDEDKVPGTNRYICANGREIEVGTIHSVKGGTHDATLILETKFNRWFDVLEMLPFMLDETKVRPIFTPNSKTKESTLAQYMRKLYVAGSRPRHLLCIALSKKHVTNDQITSLRNIGWSITNL